MISEEIQLVYEIIFQSRLNIRETLDLFTETCPARKTQKLWYPCSCVHVLPLSFSIHRERNFKEGIKSTSSTQVI